MKRGIVLFLVVMMLLSLPEYVFAEGESGLNWKDLGPFVEEAFGDEAHFHALSEVEAKIWIPDFLEEMKLTEEDREQGIIASFMSEDETSAIYVNYSDLEGLPLESFQSHLEQTGVPSYFEKTNGIRTLLYYDGKSDVLIANYETVDGYYLQVMFFPYSDETVSLLTSFVLSSIQPDVQETKEPVAAPLHPVSSLIVK